jgi:hypothetical protein
MWDFADRMAEPEADVHCELRADIALEGSECDNKNALPIFTGARATGFTEGPSVRVSLVE